MSRYGDGDYEPIIGKDGKEKNVSGLWQHSLQIALTSKRGQQALRDLRDAPMALPRHELIEGALCTVGLTERIEAMPEKVVRDVTPFNYETKEYGAPVPTEVHNYDRDSLIQYVGEHDDQPEGVCAVGAYVWWQKVKAGMDPAAAFADLPVLPDTDTGEWQTAEVGVEAGLSERLAYYLAWLNDESFGYMAADERWQLYVKWIGEHLEAVPA